MVLITIDTLRYDAVGFNGNRDVDTPNLDRLAEESRVFDHAHSHNVVTLPAHASLLTGLLPPQHGVRENSGFELAQSATTLAEIFRSDGFATAAFVSAFPLDHRSGLDQGFDVYDDRYSSGARDDDFRIGERPGDATVAAAKSWWAENATKRRFLWLHLYEPHAPYAPPEPWRSRFPQQPYLGEVATADEYLGDFLTVVEPETTVVLTADHGEALGDHGESSHGLFAYEATLRVPLVIRTPALDPGRDERSVGLIDLAPTMLAAAGVKGGEGMSGIDLLQAGPARGRPQYFEALSTYFNRGWAPLRGVVSKEWKFIDLPLPELYRLSIDPGEMRNLAGVEAERARSMRGAVPAETPWPPEAGSGASPSDTVVLRSLGYLARADERPTGDVFTVENDPKNLVELDNLIQETMAALAGKRFDQAVAQARKIIAERPSMATGHEYLVLALRGQEDIAAAERAARGGLKHHPGDASLTRLRGELLVELGDYPAARPLLIRLQEEHPDRENLILLGNLEFQAGNLSRARTWYLGVLEEDGDNARALEGLGAVALAEGDTDAAAEHLQRAVEVDPRRAIAWNGLGVVAMRRGDPNAALESWARALELDSRQLAALFNHGLVAARLGRVEPAVRSLSRFIEVAPPQYAGDVNAARSMLAQLQ